MITSSENQQQEIKQILQEEVECAHLLLKLLTQEYDALAEHHSSALEEIVQHKQEKIQQLEMIGRQREQLFLSIGMVNLKHDIDTNKTETSQSKQFNDHFKNNRQLIELWSELLNIAGQCRDKNQVNGRIVELVSRQSKHALDILRGIAPTTSDLYDNAGQSKSFSSKRTLVHV